MKTIFAVLAVSAGCGVASAQYIVDTFDSFSFVEGNNAFSPGFTPSGPTGSTVPTDSGQRRGTVAITTADGSGLARMSTSDGTWSMSWSSNTSGALSGPFVDAFTIMQWNYNGLDLGSMTTLSATGSGWRRIARRSGVPMPITGEFPDRYPQVVVQLHDMNGLSVYWQLDITIPFIWFPPEVDPTLDIDWTIDLASPVSATPGFDMHNIASLTIGHSFWIGGESNHYTGQLNYTGLAFIPSPGAAAVLGLGGLAAVRRRRR